MFKTATMAALALTLAACSTKTTEEEKKRDDNIVDATGGEIVADDGALILNVPEGAINESVEITVIRLSDDELPTGGVPGTGFQIKPDGIEFEKPVELTIRYRTEDLPQPDSSWLRVVQVLDGKKLAATQFVAHEKGEGWVRGKLTHFSSYALADLQVADAIVKNNKKKAKLDVLFLIDNSGSMGEEQANLTKNFPVFIEQLEKNFLDYRVGVISPDLGAGNYTSIPSCEKVGGDAGKLLNTPRVANCTAPTDAWISSAGKSKQDVIDEFTCIATLGTSGCGFEQTLEALYLALDPAVNPGFIREEAALAIMFITDEDDCSASVNRLFDPTSSALTDELGPLTSFRCFEFGVTCDINDRNQIGPRKDCVPKEGPDAYLHPIQRYVDRVKQLKSNGAVAVAAITGPLSPVEVKKDGATPALGPSCQSAAGIAVPPIRLGAFIAAFGERGSMEDICAEDFGPALDKVGTHAVTSNELSWCLPFAPVDTNPLTPELDADCTVTGDVIGAIPPCSADPKATCFALVSSPSCAPSKVVIELNNITSELGDELHASCLTL